MKKPNIFKLEKFLLIRKNDLQVIASIKGKTKWFLGKKFWLRIGLVVFFAIMFFVAFIFNVFNHAITVKDLNKQHKLEYENQQIINDSLANVLDDISREDSLMHRYYETCMTDCEKITHDRLWEYIKSCNPWYPDIIMMQAVQESSCGKSEVAKRCHNLFGMTKPATRKWRCDINRKNKKEQFAEYVDWRFSVIDRILWERWLFRKLNRKPTLDEYMKAIDGLYSETEGYSTHIYKHAERYRKSM